MQVPVFETGSELIGAEAEAVKKEDERNADATNAVEGNAALWQTPLRKKPRQQNDDEYGNHKTIWLKLHARRIERQQSIVGHEGTRLVYVPGLGHLACKWAMVCWAICCITAVLMCCNC